jgi:hypothetical protein
MADAAQEERWTHTASVLAMLANVNRARGNSAMAPMDFMPKRFQPPPVEVPVSVLRDLFVKPNPPGSPASPAS